MPLRRNRFTGFTVLLSSLALVVLAAGVFYYVKLRQNESFQTQLHLRELQRVAKSLEQSISSIRKSIDIDVESVQGSRDARGKTPLESEEQPDETAESDSRCMEPHEFCALKDHLKTAFPNLVAEPHDLNARESGKGRDNARKCQRRNESLAIAGGTAGACAIDGRATLNSRNFYWMAEARPRTPGDSGNAGTDAARDDADESDERPLASRYIERLKIPLDDLANASSLMPVVLLTDAAGNRIHSWENVRNHATQSSIQYRSAQALLRKVRIKQSGSTDDEGTGDSERTGIDYSDYIDLEIAGEGYRAYVMPWRNVPYFAEDCPVGDCGQGTVPDAGSSDYYLIGLQPSSSLLGNKLSISPSLVVLLVLAALLLVAFLPVIKLQLVSPEQAFTPADRQALVFGCLIFIALLVVGGYHYILYSGLKDQLNSQAGNIHGQISSHFKEEIRTWHALAEDAMQTPDTAETAEAGQGPEECRPSPDSLLSAEAFTQDSFIEGAFRLSQDGTFPIGRWSHGRHCRPDTSTNLTHRSYYKRGMSCTGWRIGDDNQDSDGECAGKYYIERVWNVRDSRLNTWLSVPLFDSPYDGEESRDSRELLVFGGRLQTFIKPVLPMHFSYVVFDNESGIVQYHSDDQASSLVDNIFVDTDNNNHLISLIDLNHETLQTFSGLYKGQEYLFSAGRITDRVPWTLLVMYEKSPFRNMNMLSLFSALLLVLGCLTLAWILYLLLPGVWRRALFRPLRFDRSRRIRDYLVAAALLFLLLFCLTLIFLSYHASMVLLVISALIAPAVVVLWRWQQEPGQRKSLAYTLCLLLLLINTVALPTMIVAEQSYRFFLNQHIALMGFDITKKIEEAQRERRHYVDSFIDPDQSDLAAARQRLRKADLVRCYLGDEKDSNHCGVTPCCGSGKGFTTDAFRYTDNQVQRVSHISGTGNGTSIVEDLWKQVNLKLEATSDFEVLAQKAPPDDRNSDEAALLYRFEPNLPRFYRSVWNDRVAWVLIAILLVILLPFWLLKTRILPNLFGLRYPDNYLSHAPGQTRAENDAEASGDSQDVARALRRMLKNYRKSDREPVYIQLIRPGAQTRALFFDAEKAESLSLLTPAPLDINSLTADSAPPPGKALEQHLKGMQPGEYRTIALRGLEHIPLNSDKRKRALQFLQYLVAQRSINVILLVDVSPLYRFIQPQAYPYKIDAMELPDSEEQIAWAALFRRFTKIYDWVPPPGPGIQCAGAWCAFLREHQGWPELRRIAGQFLAYHCAAHDYPLDEALDDLKSISDGSDSHPDTLRSRCTALADSIDRYWTADQVVDFFGTGAVAHYRYRWELCTTQERLLLIQLAHDNTPNPRNTVPIQHLLRRGYLYHQDGWRLANDSFRNFILHAEDPAVVRRWIGNANESMWKYVRIPIFIVLLSLLALLAYSAAEAFQSFLGIAAAVLGLVPLLLRNVNLIRGQSSVDT